MLQSLELDPIVDFATLETLGNTGSVALPLTMAMGIEQGHLEPGDRVALLGIGSGINALMLAVDWQQCPAAAEHAIPRPASHRCADRPRRHSRRRANFSRRRGTTRVVPTLAAATGARSRGRNS